MDNKDKLKIEHMILAIKECLSFVEGVSREGFYDNRQLILAVIKEIEIIGEAASRTSISLRENYSNIAWQDIIDTRNRLLHGYFDINIDTVWKTIEKDLPELLLELEKLK